MPHLIDLPGAVMPQRTLRAPIECTGIGVHSGQRTRLVLGPAPAGSGIVFRRSDLGLAIPARYDHVVDTRLCTVLGLPGRKDAVVGTVEHVMAALRGCGVSNAIVEIDGPEVPILDGSAEGFVFLIGCAGTVAQAAAETAVAVRRKVRVAEGDAWVELHPAGDDGLVIDFAIDFADAAIGSQARVQPITSESFRRDIAAARTFGRAAEVEHLRAQGLARGGSLDNAVVVDGGRVLNPGGLRMPDEFVRHKILDAVGDLALAGHPLLGRLVARRSGHALNHRVLRALFADDRNWSLVTLSAPLGSPVVAPSAEGVATVPPLGTWQERRLPVAAAPV